jgi:hypothetical protein
VAAAAAVVLSLRSLACVTTDDARRSSPRARTGTVSEDLARGGGHHLRDVLTQHNDNYRTGHNRFESILTTSNVNEATFGKIAHWPTHGQVYAQPLYVSRAIDGRDMLVVVDEENYVYAFDAQSTAPDGATFWPPRQLGTPVDLMTITPGVEPTVRPHLGITSTPVVDRREMRLYLVSARIMPGQTQLPVPEYELHAIDLRTGDEAPGSPVVIAATYGPKPPHELARFSPIAHVQRAGLLEKGDDLYVAFASLWGDYTGPATWGDQGFGDYHGWILRYSASSLARLGVTLTTPHGIQGGVWQAGAGLAGDFEGDVYFAVGNSAPAEQPSLGDSLVELRRDLSLRDFFRPWDYVYLNENDRDLGSAGMMLLPDTDLFVAGGKQGILYVGHRRRLGGQEPAPDAGGVHPDVQELLLGADPASLGAAQIEGAPAYWSGPGILPPDEPFSGPHVYVWAQNDVLRSYTVLGSAGVGTVPARGLRLARWWPGAFLSVSSDGDDAATGIVWANIPLNDDATTLAAYDATRVEAGELWASDGVSDDAVVGGARLGVPTVAAGRLFLGTYTGSGVPSGAVEVYGLLPEPRSLPDAGADAGASVDAEAGACTSVPPQGPITWDTLYAGVFGPGTPGHCATCHPGPYTPGDTHLRLGDGGADDIYHAFTTENVVVPGEPSAFILVDTSDAGASPLGDPARSPLQWYGGPFGHMPADTDAGCQPVLAGEITAWLEAGALR